MRAVSSPVYSIFSLLKPFRFKKASGRFHRTPHVEFTQVLCTETSTIHTAEVEFQHYTAMSKTKNKAVTVPN